MEAANVDGPWALAGIVSTTLITGILTLLMARVKGQSDEKDEPAERVLRDVESADSLRRTLDAVLTRLGQVEYEVVQSRPITKVKYPLALRTITDYQREHPDSPVVIPWQVEEDLP